MGSIQISLLFLMVYTCVNKIKGKLVKIHNKVKASIDSQTKPLKTMLKGFILKILPIEVEYALLPRTYIYLFLRD